MITIHIVGGPHAGEHRGQSPESIARRIYGRSARVRYSPDPNNPHDMVVRVDRFGTHVLASIICAR